MSVDAIVTPDAIEAKIKLALYQFLSMFFNGTSHQVGVGDPLLFPSVDLKFKREQLPAILPRPRIQVMALRGKPERIWQKRRGYDVRTEGTWRFLAYTADRTDNWLVNDQVQERLGILFRTARFHLAKSGLRVLEVDRPVAMPDGEHEYQVSYRDVRLTVVVGYEFAGIRETAPISGGIA